MLAVKYINKSNPNFNREQRPNAISPHLDQVILIKPTEKAPQAPESSVTHSSKMALEVH